MTRTPLLPTLLAALAAGALLAQPAASRPGDVVRQATLAVERDSVATLRTAWSQGAAPRTAAGPDRGPHALGLATLDRLTYDYDGAARAFERLAGGHDAVAAYALLGLAEAAYTRGELPPADSLAAAALGRARAVADAEAEARALVLLAETRGPTVGLEPALALLDSAERVLPAAAGDVRAELLRFRAVILAVQADFALADSVVRDCLEVARATGLRRAEAQCHRSRALAYRLRDMDDSAVALLDVVERLQREAGDLSALSETLQRRSDALRGRVRYGEALSALREARELAARTRNEFALGSAHLGLGSIALRLRDHATAGRELDAAERIFERTGDVGSRMGVVGFRSLLDARLGDLETARRRARETADHYRGIGDVNEEFATLRHLAAVEIRARDWPAAERALSEAAALARRAGQAERLYDLEFDRGRIALLRGRLDDAERRFRRYHAQLDTTAYVLQYVARAHLADIHARRGDLPRAERELAAAGDDLDRWRAGLSDERLRLHAFQAVGNDIDSHDPSTERVLAALAAGGRAEAALALAERRRARTLADRLAQGRAMRADGDDGAAAERTGHATRLVPVGGVPAGARDAAAAARAIAAALPDDRTAIVEYVAGSDGAPTTLLAVTRGGTRAWILPPADSLAPAVERLVTLLEGGDDPGALSRTLGATLLAPALDALGDSVHRLVVVPDGPLHRVPFDALRLADGRFVVERFATSVVPSASVAVALWSRPRADRAGTARILAIGDPDFGRGPASGDASRDGADPDGDVFRDSWGADSVLARLPASGREARLVAGFSDDAEVRLRGDASAEGLLDSDLSGFDVLHLATHALVDDRAIGRSALLLAASGGRSGLLGAGDLGALELDASLVVLSACRTAGGVVLDGEGVQGLTAPLLQAGARSVVATAWRIGDESTVRLVLDFYAALADGEAVGDALRTAKLAALARGAPPAEWAAFTVVGDPTVTVPLRHPDPGVPALPLAAAALAALAGIGAVAWHVGRRRA